MLFDGVSQTEFNTLAVCDIVKGQRSVNSHFLNIVIFKRGWRLAHNNDVDAETDVVSTVYKIFNTIQITLCTTSNELVPASQPLTPTSCMYVEPNFRPPTYDPGRLECKGGRSACIHAIGMGGCDRPVVIPFAGVGARRSRNQGLHRHPFR